MNINNINIGDLFMVNDPNYPNTMKVTEIDKPEGEYYWITFEEQNSSKGCMVGSTSDIIVPIPLTTDILTANGFKISSSTLDSNLDVETSTYILHRPNDGLGTAVVYTAESQEFTWCGCRLSYVHELQHALRLFGCDDKGDNFKL